MIADGGQQYNYTTGNWSGGLELWNVAANQVTALNTTEGYVYCVAFSPDGKTIAAGGYFVDSGIAYGSIEMWDVATKKLVVRQLTSATVVNSLAFSPDGTLLVDGGAGLIEITNLKTGRRLILNTAAVNGVDSVAFSPDGKFVADAGSYNNYSNGVVELWNSSSGELISTLPLAAGTGFVKAVTFSPDGAVLFAGTGNDLQVFDLSTYSLLDRFSVGYVDKLVVSPDGSLLSFASSSFAVAKNPFFKGLQSLSFAPATVVGGASSTGTVLLGGPAPIGGSLVGLSSASSDAVVPTQVAISAGSTSATFTVMTSAVGASTPVTITATMAGTLVSQTLTVTPAGVANLTLSPSSVVGGNVSTGSVALSGAAPSGGLVVGLSSSDSGVTVPASVTIAGGATSANFTVTTSTVSSSITVAISASLGGTSKVATLTVSPLALQSVTLSPSAETGGSPSSGTVALNGPAGSGGVTVSLSSNSQTATVPGSITIPFGESSAPFPVSTAAVTAQKVVTITATYNGSSNSASLTLSPATLQSISVKPSNVSGGISATGTVILTGPAPSGGLTVKLSSSTAKASLPATVKIAAGTSSGTFSIKTSAVATQTIASLLATLGSEYESITLTINPPSLISLNLKPSNIVGLTPSFGTVTLSGPAPSGGMSIQLTSGSESAIVPGSITIPAGSTHETFAVKTVSVADQTLAMISGFSNGLTLTATLTINPPPIVSLTLSPTSVRGGKTSNCTVTLGAAVPPSGISISVTSNSGSAIVPATVAVFGGKKTATFKVATAPVSSQLTVSIKATFGATSKVATLTIKH